MGFPRQLSGVQCSGMTQTPQALIAAACRAGCVIHERTGGENALNTPKRSRKSMPRRGAALLKPDGCGRGPRPLRAGGERLSLLDDDPVPAKSPVGLVAGGGVERDRATAAVLIEARI